MKKPWIGIQRWENPIFVHWPVPYEVLRPLVPDPFALDTFNGQAWVGIVPFKASRTSLRWGSGLFTMEPHWQLNIRTYIRFYEEPAVYFLKVYTSSRLSALGANLLLSLPYQHALFNTHSTGDSISCSLTHTGQQEAAQFTVDVEPSSESFTPIENTLEHWLTERYHFYTIKGKHIVKATISHKPWNLHEPRLETRHNNLVDFIPVNSTPFVHVATPQTTYLHPFQVKGKYF